MHRLISFVLGHLMVAPIAFDISCSSFHLPSFMANKEQLKLELCSVKRGNTKSGEKKLKKNILMMRAMLSISRKLLFAR
jgi:hypothetical protein